MSAPTEKAPLVSIDIAKKAFRLMSAAKQMAELYEENKAITAKYVHAASRGHEAIQIALGLQLQSYDYVAPYYRDDSILMSIGMRPYDCMLQLLAKRDDPFSGGRTYYSHPSLNDADKPKIPHQSSATGMQAIPTAGVAMGIQYREKMGLTEGDEKAIAVCSIGDAAMTEGEVSEALQMAALKQFPLLFLVQDNEWDISANAKETRAQNAAEFAQGFKGIEVRSIDGSNFEESYATLEEVIELMRKERRPFLVHAKVPLLGHHTSGVRKEFYRDDLEEHALRDPWPKLRAWLAEHGLEEAELDTIYKEEGERVLADYNEALAQEDPRPEDLFTHDFAPSPITEEKGERSPQGKEKTVMVDAALFAIQEIMAEHKEALLYGQDVGGRLGGVFREAATLAQKFGDDRVFNTPIQEAFIIGSTVGMSATGLKPFVEVQFADYIWPGLNQLFTEVSRSSYLSNGKWPVSSVIRVPIGAYGSGGPYHSSSVESVLTNIRGIKIAYPSTGADLKGLMKAAYYDPNPVVMLEHKGLYWSKVKGTEDAKTVEPSADYVLPFGKGRIAYEASAESMANNSSLLVVTYGMGVYWAKAARQALNNKVEVLDLRTLYPLDEELILERVKAHGKVLIVTEEPSRNGFSQGLAGWIQQEAFRDLDAPVMVLGSENMPAIPLNSTLEATMIPNAEKVQAKLEELAAY
ncbi:alpha-ketoacid dehydrogenase subunit alpha/beta [Croceimicrobium hydrocarbonivorans]|uniref:3-methyl-2-oxobutanoate dehydrogenase (2-methylpropanoyl-transferring) n=1 Tax=Croceimicrobium hydrocarbonivorans TaxID=2761580 RepID=A0A7H0VJ56_9FLAO|nr:alpha-ketoacid dehydrogenase subunit alpha/beta [Croceimicrobium hydrocarbonivorans]QNR25754.1 tungsten formylmethanofuran dehydrogenase [Croceimicrobium hydrocarbonivorans]